jgi:hypothetical protein
MIWGDIWGRLFRRRQEEPAEPYFEYRCVECRAPYGSPHERGCPRAERGQSVVVSEDVEGEPPLEDQYAGGWPIEDISLWGWEVDRLSYRERQVLQDLYGATRRTYGEIANTFQTTPQRVKMIADQAMKHLLTLQGRREHDPVLGPEQGGDRRVEGISQLPSRDQDEGPRAESSE